VIVSGQRVVIVVGLRPPATTQVRRPARRVSGEIPRGALRCVPPQKQRLCIVSALSVRRRHAAHRLLEGRVLRRRRRRHLQPVVRDDLERAVLRDDLGVVGVLAARAIAWSAAAPCRLVAGDACVASRPRGRARADVLRLLLGAKDAVRLGRGR
jgi:hypothetical protein